MSRIFFPWFLPRSPQQGGGRGVVVRLFSRVMRRLMRLIFFAMLLPLTAIVALRWLPAPCSSFITIRQVERLLSGGAVPPLRYHWVDRAQISPYVSLAVIAAEDQRFPDHWGFDFNAISRAVDYNSASEKVRGASTISQQTAKNLFLWSGRSYLRKGLEVGLTLCIEALWPKERILEMYLNVAEFGDNVYGIHAAGQTFFGKTPDRLSRREAALLAGVLPSPRRLHADQPSPYLLARAQWISTHMGKLGGPRFLERLDNARP